MPTPLPTAPSCTPYCLLSLTQVDVLHDHAHRIELYGNLVSGILDNYAATDQALEGLNALVGLMIDHAQGIKTLEEQGCQAVKGGA